MAETALHPATGPDAPFLGRRLPGDAAVARDGTATRATSALVEEMIRSEAARGRIHWLCLSVTLDGITLSFWLPQELDHVAQVFAMRPFPTARTLIRHSPGETRLNAHWLSRLPKAAKAPKFRARFLAFLESAPPDVVAFRRFYGA